MSTSPKSILLILTLILSISLPTAHSLTLSQWRTLLSFSHSLMTRVAVLRASRGDFSGSARARKIAENLGGGGFGLWNGALSMSWDYFRNYAWREMNWSDMSRTASEFNQLLSAMSELARLESDRDRAAWVVRNYQSVLGVFSSLLQRLLQVFVKQGPFRELVLTLQKEVEGGLLRDCLELGSNDLKGLIQILKDVGLQFSKSNGDNHYERYDL